MTPEEEKAFFQKSQDEEELEDDESESESEESEVETEEDEEEEEPPVGHKEELDRVKERLGKKIDVERGKRIKAEREKGISREEAERIADERVSQMRKEFSRNRAEELAERLSQSKEEKELILLHYDNSIVPSGNLEEDIENAYALANRKSNQKKIDELKRSALSKKTRGGGSGAGAPQEGKKQVKISNEDRDAAAFAGVPVEEFIKKKLEK